MPNTGADFEVKVTMRAIPCPFCEYGTPTLATGVVGHYVMCADCGAAGPTKEDQLTAIVVWNTRYAYGDENHAQ